MSDRKNHQQRIDRRSEGLISRAVKMLSVFTRDEVIRFLVEGGIAAETIDRVLQHPDKRRPPRSPRRAGRSLTVRDGQTARVIRQPRTDSASEATINAAIKMLTEFSRDHVIRFLIDEGIATRTVVRVLRSPQVGPQPCDHLAVKEHRRSVETVASPGD